MKFIKTLLFIFVLTLANQSPVYSQERSAEFIKNEKAAIAGDVNAQAKLGDMYKKGMGVTWDSKQAVKWYTKAAEQGHLEAQLAMARHYYNNFLEAEKWLTLAAKQGNERSQARLATAYYMGIIVEKNLAKAFKWATLSAEQGNRESQQNLAQMYTFGEGTQVNLVYAYMWNELSGGAREFVAGRFERSLAGRMTENQIMEAKRLASEWITGHPELSETD